MVLSWEQATGLLYSSGDVQRISLWDTHKEIKIQVMHEWSSLWVGGAYSYCKERVSQRCPHISGPVDYCRELFLLGFIFAIKLMAHICYSNCFMDKCNSCSWQPEHHTISRYGGLQDSFKISKRLRTCPP